MFRKSILWLHRWTGLAITAFIIVMAVTGTILAFHTELDRMLNPALMTVPVRDAPLLDAVALRERAAAMEPHAPFEYFNLKVTPGRSFCLGVVRAKTDPSTGKPYDLGFDQLYLDPYTGEKVGSRNSSHSLIPFLFNLHYGMTFGNRGVRLFGFISLLWTITSIIGIYLTFPLQRRRSKASEQTKDTPKPPGRSWWRRWMLAWKIKWGGGTYRMSYDIHRAFGLWTWLLLFIFAWSGVALNLPAPYMRTMNFLRLTVRNSVGEHLTIPEKPPGPPALDWRAALERGRVLIRETGLKEGYTVREEYFMRVLPYYGVYQYDVISSKAPPGAEIQDAGVFIDANSGELRDHWLLSKSPPGTIITRWLVALHMGTFLGLPMKILIFLSGIITTALCVTGVIIWWKKRVTPSVALADEQEQTDATRSATSGVRHFLTTLTNRPRV